MKEKSADYLIGHAYFVKKQSIENVLRSKLFLCDGILFRQDNIVSSIFEVRVGLSVTIQLYITGKLQEG